MPLLLILLAIGFICLIPTILKGIACIIAEGTSEILQDYGVSKDTADGIGTLTGGLAVGCMVGFTVNTASNAVNNAVNNSTIGYLNQPTGVNPNQTYVNGYYRTDGTYVHGHNRTYPDGILSNNIRS